jgi:chemotaxis protein methyltransferase CheR
VRDRRSNQTEAAPLEREFDYTERDFRTVQKMIKEAAGIALSDSKTDLVYSRLARKLRVRGLHSFSEYLKLLKAAPPHEIVEFVNALTTNVTQFFREPQQFDYFAETALQELMIAKVLDHKLRIWSAACSTGQEAYSIAMTVRETLGSDLRWDVQILATDLDSSVIESAARGTYTGDELLGLPDAMRRRWMCKGRRENPGEFRVAPELSRMITYRQLNLLDVWPMKGPFDAIFCRNAAIYFDKETQRTLFDRLANMLTPRGYLFIGHSESLIGKSDRFEFCGGNIYRNQA